MDNYNDRLQTIARHVMNIHMNRGGEENGDVGELGLDKMKRFIAYCKRFGLLMVLPCNIPDNASSKCAPRLSPDAQEMLSSHFVSLRKEVQEVERDNDERSSIPITVR
jgi:DNA replication licensing factor MCM5